MPTRAPPNYAPQRHCFKPYTSLCAGAKSASEFSSMFRDQVLSRKVGEAASKVRRDFHAIRKVGERMGLMGAKLCFDAWRAWGKERRFQRERMAEEDRRKKILEAQEAWAAKRLQEAEKAKWVAKVDPFTDKVRTPHARSERLRHRLLVLTSPHATQTYYEHSETGEVSWSVPDGREFRARVEVMPGGGQTTLVGAAAAASAAATDVTVTATGEPVVNPSAFDGPLAQLRKLAQLQRADASDSSDDDEHQPALPGVPAT